MCGKGREASLGGREQGRYSDLLSQKRMLRFVGTIQSAEEQRFHTQRWQRATERKMIGSQPC